MKAWADSEIETNRICAVCSGTKLWKKESSEIQFEEVGCLQEAD